MLKNESFFFTKLNFLFYGQTVQSVKIPDFKLIMSRNKI